MKSNGYIRWALLGGTVERRPCHASCLPSRGFAVAFIPQCLYLLAATNNGLDKQILNFVSRLRGCSSWGYMGVENIGPIYK